MKKIGCVLAAVFFVLTTLQGQEYEKVKINLTNSLQVKGRNARIDGETLLVTTGGVTKEYKMDFVSAIMAKDGKAEKWALGCGLGCFVGSYASLIVEGDSYLDEQNVTMGQYLVSTMFWSGVSAGLGYLFGTLIDPYEVVYVKQTSFLKRINLDVTSQPLAMQPSTGAAPVRLPAMEPMLRLSYRF